MGQIPSITKVACQNTKEEVGQSHNTIHHHHHASCFPVHIDSEGRTQYDTEVSLAYLAKVLAFASNAGIGEDQADHFQKVVARQAALVSALNAEAEVVVQRNV